MDHPDNRYLARAPSRDARAYSTQHVDIVPSVTFGALCNRARARCLCLRCLSLGVPDCRALIGKKANDKNCTALRFPNVSPEKGGVVLVSRLTELNDPHTSVMMPCQSACRHLLDQLHQLGHCQTDPNKVYAAGFLFGKYNLEGIQEFIAMHEAKAIYSLTGMSIYQSIHSSIHPQAKSLRTISSNTLHILVCNNYSTCTYNQVTYVKTMYFRWYRRNSGLINIVMQYMRAIGKSGCIRQGIAPKLEDRFSSIIYHSTRS